MDWPVPRDLDPAYAEGPDLANCDGCGELTEIDERGNVMCDECKEFSEAEYNADMLHDMIKDGDI